MTDNDIIKALECCPKADCDICPYEHRDCLGEMYKDTIDLINRKQAKIERLEIVEDGFIELQKLYRTAKAEAVKEFADTVLLYIPNIDGETTIKCVEEAIKQTLKELVGDNK